MADGRRRRLVRKKTMSKTGEKRKQKKGKGKKEEIRKNYRAH
jgi:hypothetical protein